MGMKIKEGMYVRTTKGIGKIEQVIDTDDKYDKYRYIVDISKIYIFNDDDILTEPSFNILKVIKEGDIVTIKSKYCKDDVYKVDREGDIVIGLDCIGEGTMYVDASDIKQVLTKEQFESMSYKLED